MHLNKFISPYRSIVKLGFTNFTQVSQKLPFPPIICGYASMTSKPNLKPPEHVAGQTVLDKSSFEKTITVHYIHAKNVKISSIMPHIKQYLLKIDNFKPVKTVAEHETEIYLNPELVTSWQDLAPETRDALLKLNLGQESFRSKPQTLRYENFSVEAVLRAILPPETEGMSSFTKIGHIVHVNLREHLIPYKSVIGKVLFEKVAGCRSVVNKVAEIDNTYRNFAMEILQGDGDMRTEVKENRCLFEFDFSKVYWNSRLCTEHERIVNLVKSGDVVFDMFAGVGPFSVPAAKKKCVVYANDLNPESYKWLNHNIAKNKIDRNRVKTYNKDGRDFIVGEIRNNLLKHLCDKSRIFIIMNLPALAVEFLDAFLGLYKDEDLPEIASAPTVIVYCFAKGEDYVNIAKNLLFRNIGFDIGDKIIEIFRVRTVSSLKEMMRISFRLDRDILTGSISKSRKRAFENDGFETNSKKCNHGEKQEENKQRLQSCRGEKLETEVQSESCEN